MVLERSKELTELTDLTALAIEAFGPVGSQKTAEERGWLINKMMRPLWGMAWRLACPSHDLADELRSHVLLRCEEGRYDPELGSFTAWVRTVMTRYLITLSDPRKRAFGGEKLPRESADTRHSLEIDEGTAPFATEDLERIHRWKSPLKRVLLLSHSLLWRKMPAALWAADLAELGLTDPFPIAEFDDMTRAERTAYLADALGVPRNTIHVRMNRWEHLVRELKFVRSLGREM